MKSAPQSGDTYGSGETIVFTVTFSQKVRVAGQPQPTLAFDLGGSREARYEGMTDTDVDSDAGALSVADAEATEGMDRTLDFVVKLDRTPSRDWEVTVDYRTQDGTATAGSDLHVDERHADLRTGR